MINFTPLLRVAANRRLNQIQTLKPIEQQQKTLLELVHKARSTKFGLDHKFAKIKSVSEYQQAVQLRRYEDFWYDYWQPTYPKLINCTWPGQVPFFCVSSGTSVGSAKNIPCTHEMIAANTKAGFDLLCWHLHNRPSSQIGQGSTFFLGGSTALDEITKGVFSGDLSGIQALKTPWWIKKRYFPPPHLALLSDWNEKINKLSVASLKYNVTLLGGVPSWLLIFIDVIGKHLNLNRPLLLENIYPNLELLVHGGVNFGPYKRQFDQLMSNSKAETREVYPASEGFIALADRGYGEGLRMNLDHGLFFEFIPVDQLDSAQPTRHWIGNIETDLNYALVLTTCSGLWSYIIGDTVKFIERDPPRILITGRTSYSLSAFGEHLIGIEIEECVTKSAETHNININDYSVGAVFPTPPEPLGYHLYVVECTELVSIEKFNYFLKTLDTLLQERNEDYRAHRAEGFGMKQPNGIMVPPGTFKAWMTQRGKLGGQNKVPRIINDKSLFDSLCSFAQSRLNQR
jgi:hypothetical protein